MQYRGSSILFVHKGKILLLKRSKTTNNPGTWGLPGGQRDSEDKDPWATAKRESTEELGMKLPKLDKCGKVTIKRKHHPGNPTVVFVCRVKHKFEPPLDHESSAFKWTTIKKAKNMNIVYWLKPLFKRITKNRTNIKAKA